VTQNTGSFIAYRCTLRKMGVLCDRRMAARATLAHVCQNAFRRCFEYLPTETCHCCPRFLPNPCYRSQGLLWLLYPICILRPFTVKRFPRPVSIYVPVDTYTIRSCAIRESLSGREQPCSTVELAKELEAGQPLRKVVPADAWRCTCSHCPLSQTVLEIANNIAWSRVEEVIIVGAESIFAKGS
jgi:hypothetical protein